jgi:hypothetical protein
MKEAKKYANIYESKVVTIKYSNFGLIKGNNKSGDIVSHF